MSIRVLVVDDHPVVHYGLKSLFEGTDIELVGAVFDGNQAIKTAIAKNPDVVLMDVRMPECDGLKALEAIRERLDDSRVVMYSSYDNPTYVARSIALGAHDYVLKSDPPKRLVAAIRNASRGTEPPEETLFQNIKASMRRRRDQNDELHPLTHREIQVLRHVALGLSNREIGKSLGISIETVKEHVQNILRKVNANDRTQAAVWAVKRGLV